MKICLLGATLSTTNQGVGALAAGAVRCVLARWPEAEISLLDYGREPTRYTLAVGGRAVEIPLVNLRFSKKFWLPNNVARLIAEAMLLRLLGARGGKSPAKSKNPWRQHIRDADLCAAISGGDSFSDTYGLGRLLYVALPQILVLLMGKRLVLLPQTIGPFRGGIARRIARYVLCRAEVVYSRDERSLPEIAALAGVNHLASKVRFSYDVGFALEPAAPRRVEITGLASERAPGACRVGLNVSGLLAIGGYSRKNMFGLRTDYNELVRAMIHRLLEKKGTELLLVPHVFGDGEESDAVVCRQVYDELKQRYAGRVGCVEGRYDQSEIKHIIGRCDFFIGSRMHACIAAVSQNIPAVAIAYSDKFIGVMETVGVPSLVVDARKMEMDQVLAAISGAFDQRDTLRAQLLGKMPAVKQSVLRLFEQVGG
jgi:colanic acid/amylovoran biosynthesis protein